MTNKLIKGTKSVIIIFIINMFLELLRIFKIKDIQGKPYHPQSRGQVEHKNQTIKKAVCKRKKCSCWTKYMIVV